MAQPPSNIDIRAIRSECIRIIRADYRLFNALIFLFLSPISLSLTFCQVFPIKTLIPNLLYTLTISVLSLFAAGSVTHSVFHGFHGRPVKLSSATKAALTSFFPLLSTWLVTQLIISGIGLTLGLVLFSLFEATQLLGVVYVTILVSIVVYSQVNWIFAYVIVVVESSWGLEPLKRSQNLVKGMKGVAFKIVLVLSIFCWFGTWSSMLRLVDSDGIWTSLIRTVTLPASSYYMVFVFFNLSVNAVFYMYSKALHEGSPESM
ncbi:hypothetical protein V6N13_055544 [Hibiscus sabdariffa]|uniref:Uncharacterized protein n=2 Tax=Hibiscus sabdariffa TaxID=183260 RepID=A0ABR2BM27_9ROSI